MYSYNAAGIGKIEQAVLTEEKCGEQNDDEEEESLIFDHSVV